MKYSKLGIFLCGVLAGAMLLGCGTAALAANAGGVSFDVFGLKLNGTVIAEQGKRVINDSNCEIPATIVYTDETGGGNTYLPISTISKLLNIPITWQDNTVHLGNVITGHEPPTITVGKQPIDQIWIDQPTNSVGAQAGPYTEVEPFWPEQTGGPDDRVLFYQDIDTHISSPIDISGAYRPDPTGCYYSVSVENHTDTPMMITMRVETTLTQEDLPSTIVPANQTVIRTFLVDPGEGYLYPPRLGYALSRNFMSGENDPLDVTLNSVCFEK